MADETIEPTPTEEVTQDTPVEKTEEPTEAEVAPAEPDIPPPPPVAEEKKKSTKKSQAKVEETKPAEPTPTEEEDEEGKEFIQSEIDSLKRVDKEELFNMVTGIMDAPFRELNVRASGVFSSLLDRAAKGDANAEAQIGTISEEIAKMASHAVFNEFSNQIESIYKTVGVALDTKLSQMAMASDELLKSLKSLGK